MPSMAVLIFFILYSTRAHSPETRDTVSKLTVVQGDVLNQVDVEEVVQGSYVELAANFLLRQSC